MIISVVGFGYIGTVIGAVLADLETPSLQLTIIN